MVWNSLERTPDRFTRCLSMCMNEKERKIASVGMNEFFPLSFRFLLVFLSRRLFFNLNRAFACGNQLLSRFDATGFLNGNISRQFQKPKTATVSFRPPQRCSSVIKNERKKKDKHCHFTYLSHSYTFSDGLRLFTPYLLVRRHMPKNLLRTVNTCTLLGR